MPKKHAYRAVLSPLVFLLSAVLALASCSSGARLERDPAKTPAGVSRADPGYLQYLEKQSMLGGSAELAAIVSGSGLAWRVPGSGPNAEGMLRLAGVWLHVHPQTVLAPGHSSPLSQLGGPLIWNALDKGGVRGIYIAPTGGSGGLWDSERRKVHGDNEDVVAYQFARYIGKDEDYKVAAKSAVAFQGLLGGDLVPPATGIGPDFFLASRDFRNYTGVYCMVEVPKGLWPLLPQIKEESQVYPLDEAQAAALQEKGLIPARLQQETLAYLPASGWAVTGEVRGVDGNLRRWVYRYFNGYKRPVLNWADPSATARQVINGSVIRQVGLFGNAISGFRVRPFIGLERYTPDYSTARPNPERGIVEENALGNYTLAMEASTNLARQARSYGGWSWQRDELPLPLVREFLAIGPDFIHDSVFSPAAEHALLTGNAALLRFMADEALAQEIDFKRLVHTSAGHEGVSYLLPHLHYLASLKADAGSFTDAETRAVKAKNLLAERLLAQMREAAVKVQSGETLHPLYRPRVAAEPELPEHASAPLGRPLPTAVPEEQESELKVKLDPEYQEAAEESAGAAASDGAQPQEASGGNAPAGADSADSPESGEDAPEPEGEELPAESGSEALKDQDSTAVAASDQDALTAAPAVADETAEGGEDTKSVVATAPVSGTHDAGVEIEPAAGPEEGDALPTPDAPPLQDDIERLYLTPAGIAAAGLGLEVHTMQPHDYTDQDKEEIERGHSLLVFFKAMQPGMLMLSGQDLVGLMPLTWRSMHNTPEQWSPHQATLGTFPILGSSQSVQINSMGLPRGNSLYGPLDVQTFIPDSFLNRLGGLLRLRESLGVAEGELAGRLKGKGGGFIGLVTRLPGGKGYAVSLCNFSRDSSAESLQTRHVPGLAEAIRNGKVSVAHGSLEKRDFKPESLNFTIPGWEGALLVIAP